MIPMLLWKPARLDQVAVMGVRGAAGGSWRRLDHGMPGAGARQGYPQARGRRDGSLSKIEQQWCRRRACGWTAPAELLVMGRSEGSARSAERDPGCCLEGQAPVGAPLPA